MSEIEKLKAALRRHDETRPDSLAATRPDAPVHIRQTWDAWLKTKWDLQTKLDMAKSVDMNQWRDRQGNIVAPSAWNGQGLLKDMAESAPVKEKAKPERIPALELLDRLHQEIAALKCMEPASPEWNEQRAKAACTRHLLVCRVVEDELRMRIPDVPRLSDIKPLQSARRKERDRIRKAKLRALKVQKAAEAAK